MKTTFLILLALLLTACQPASTATPIPSTTPPPTLTAITETLPNTPTPGIPRTPPPGATPTRTPETSIPDTPSTFSEWATRAPLLEPNSEIAVAGLDGRIYVIGGQSSTAGGGPFLDMVFEFKPATSSWTSRAPITTARGGGAAAVIDGKIYVAGGRPPAGSDFAVYDPVLDAWTELPGMPTPRNHLAAVAVRGKLYVFGGRFGAGFRSEMTDAVEMFDPQTNTWTARAPMPTVRGGLNAVAANGCIHVFGGEGSGGVFPQHEAYDPGSDAWCSFGDMPTPVHGVTGAAYIDGWIHLPGGGTEVGGSSGSTLHQVVRVEMVCGSK